jgi:hypothetical protein
MAKYLILWEIDQSRTPVDAKERGQMLRMMLETVKQDLKAGIHKDWGSYVGETRGYTISEGEHVEIAKLMQRFAPYVTFQMREIASVDDNMEVAKSLTG